MVFLTRWPVNKGRVSGEKEEVFIIVVLHSELRLVIRFKQKQKPDKNKLLYTLVKTLSRLLFRHEGRKNRKKYDGIFGLNKKGGLFKRFN